VYDFRCGACGRRFEALAKDSQRPSCPDCGASESERLFTPFAGPFTIGLRGLAARRSNAARSAREEQRRERFAARARERASRGAADSRGRLI